MSFYSGVPHRVPSPNPNPVPVYRSASPNPMAAASTMYRTASPIPSPAVQPQPMGAIPGQIVPGTITYTTSYDPNGTLIYHPFRAVPVSYQTASGVIAGTQWIPADATTVLPSGAQPANAEFTASWARSYKEDDKDLRNWQKDEEKRRRKEEKEATKRVARAERDRRERDVSSRLSSVYGGVPTVAGSAGTGYAPTSPYSSAYASPMADLERRLENTDISRRRSGVYADAVPPSPISTAANPGYAPAAGYYPPGSSPYRPPGALPGTYPGEVVPGHPRSRAPSPIPGAGPYGPRSRAASPVPPGTGFVPPHPRSRAASPMPPPYAGVGAGYPPVGVRPPASPRPGEAVLAAGADGRLPPPDGFVRPPNLAQSYTWFDLMKIQDMEAFYDVLPRMPLVLVPHDVYHDDWIRFMQDLALAWAGRMPALSPNGSHKGSALAMDLIELWNQSFFHQRGVDVILYRGRLRRTGRHAGEIDATLPGFDNDDSDEDSSDLSTSSLSESDDDGRPHATRSPYASAADPYAQAQLQDAKRRNREKKAEKKRRHKERKARRKAKERERRYALYIACLPQYDN
ncbi:hypothetical protein K488DRAFT_82460 [Vararia minispora EC-137]|uniref:Uncharacterized protein n=1 Tax=Vararia minispora EC-137 TaxID=1314806 RepID=A0ACB8QWM7_9AGAM|nr:hypothetical protein K488DRAFT_82460 [Vararia minispora EC-137]